MKNLKKIALLLSIITVFVISCGGSQQALNSTFDVITDDETSVPDNPPSVVKDPDLEPLPEDFKMTPENFSSEDINQGNWGVAHPVNIQKGTRVSSFSYQTVASFESRTAGVANPKGVLSSIELRNPQSSLLPNQYRLDVKSTMFGALGSSGQSAKIKVEVYIDAQDSNGKKFQTGVRTLYVSVKRIV